MRRFCSAAGGLIFLVCLWLTPIAVSEGFLEWVDPPDSIRPGKAIRLSFSASLAGDVSILVNDPSGETIATIEEDFPAKAGRNDTTWDGMALGMPLPSGNYVLQVAQGANKASTPVIIGDLSPVILSAIPSDTHLVPGKDWSLQVETNLSATLTLMLIQNSENTVLYEALLPAGIHEIPWDGKAGGQALTPGSYVIGLTLMDEKGFLANGEHLTITVEAPIKEPQLSTPNPESVSPAENNGTEKNNSPADFSSYTCDHESCFFKLPMGVMNEAAIWEAMMLPIVVVRGEQRQVVKVYAQPDKNSEAVGEVTCTSQGLHVLKTLDNGWTLIEAYSSSIHTSKVKNWAGFFSGYIETSKLETKQPNQKYGLLLDKLTQRMYVFEEGKIITELLISTGLVNKEQPYNETPAGEFMIVSWTGGFWSGNMWCDLALRVNGGILIHEVPCFLNEEDNVRDYKPFERKLGQKASHGCIRVQQKKSPEGINMRWLWDNLKLNTRVFIWDDVGRQIPIPDAGMPLYYNPDGGKYYHGDAYCKSVKDRFLPLTGFTYGELESDPYSKLDACPSCSPPKRAAEIEALNAGNR